MVWHPDHHMQKSAAEQAYVAERFKRVQAAHTATRAEATRLAREEKKRARAHGQKAGRGGERVRERLHVTSYGTFYTGSCGVWLRPVSKK